MTYGSKKKNNQLNYITPMKKRGKISEKFAKIKFYKLSDTTAIKILK